jgi:hypothetical protein
VVSRVKMLTRHFYEADEVCRCLLHALRFRRAKEAVFWARELLLSHEPELLYKTMIQCWIVLLGGPCIHWLDAWTTTGADVGGCRRLVLVAEFSGLVSPRRAPLQCFVMAARGTAEKADMDLVAAAVAAEEPFGLYWHLAAKPAAVLEAVSSYVDSPEIFSSLKVVMDQRFSIHIKTLLAVCAVQVLCLSEYPGPLECDEAAAASWLAEWEPTIGRRGGRHYEIDQVALGHGKRVTAAEGLLLSPAELLSRGTAFWLAELAIIKDDDSLERITDLQFPDDIPDEWSSSDRSKSHPEESTASRMKLKPVDQMKNVYGLGPALRRTWAAKLKHLFEATLFPERS